MFFEMDDICSQTKKVMFNVYNNLKDVSTSNNEVIKNILNKHKKLLPKLVVYQL